MHENDVDNIYMFLEVIDDELRKAGIPPATRLGTHRGVGDYGLQACEYPRVG